MSDALIPKEMAGRWLKSEILHCLLPTVVLATQLRGEFKQSDFIIPSLLVSHLILFYEY